MTGLLLKKIPLMGVSNCELRRSTRAKRIRIEVRPDNSLLIVVPNLTREDQWLAFVLSKKRWIEKAINSPVMKVEIDSSFPLAINFSCRQEQYEIFHISSERNGVKIENNHLQLRCTSTADGHRYLVLRRWLMEQSRDEFSHRLGEISKATGLSWNNLSIRGQKTRWGSCSSAGNISLNFKLLFLSSELVDHVLLHELVHTREMNHSAKFWGLMKKFDPCCDRRRKELRLASQSLPGWLINV